MDLIGFRYKIKKELNLTLIDYNNIFRPFSMDISSNNFCFKRFIER